MSSRALLGSSLAALTDRTITSKAVLAEQLNDIRERGYASQTGELRADSACVAVPVRSPAGTLVAAQAMSGRADQDQLLHRQIPVLQDYATQLGPLLA
ncbi:MAG: IclR family transcriptional regulator C-terminal domain-containing protein [Mycobacterium sp.]|nr:IclR family transcriptional regulator C-terminal domain-containing protein [Mycobacterium sp.]